MLFGMIERGMDGEVLGDKGKLRAPPVADSATKQSGDEAMWAVILSRELWKKCIW
jgi:protein SDA1